MVDSNPAVSHIDSPGQTSEKVAPSRPKAVEPSLEVLHKRVATNAILNAGGRADKDRCNPGTRKEVIDRVEEWRQAEGTETPPMFWLSGPAGAGKSAIMQTIAESYKEQGTPQANFFFFRGDTTRSHASPLVPTLVYQVTSLYPSLRDPIASLISADPAILDSRLEDQLRQLIVEPLCTIQQSSPVYQPLLLFIDGLDECDSTTKDSQERILLAFDRVLVGSKPFCPFRLLMATRYESQIQLAFNKISSQCRILYLHDEYSPERDIRAFVEAMFAEVRKTHGLAHTLDAAWPSADDVESIVKKSSGHYIYAATVMRFILRSSVSPIVSLERVRAATRLATKSPFSHLDVIYTYILSQVKDQDALKDILHARASIAQVKATTAQLLESYGGEDVLIMDLLDLYNKKYTKAVVLSCFAGLAPLARYAMRSQELLFYHASFSDYLSDQSRSKDYFVNLVAFNYKIIPAVWQFIRHAEGSNSKWLKFGLSSITHLQGLPPHLMLLVSESYPFKDFILAMKSPIFQPIYNLCASNDDIKHFRSFFLKWFQCCDLDKCDLNGIKNIPFARMYHQMARARRGYALDHEMVTNLRPITDLDRDDLSAWLQDFLSPRRHVIDGREYKQLLRTWMPWAVENNISLTGIKDIPVGRMYYQMARAERGSALDVEMATSLRPETTLDRDDLSAWLPDFISSRRGVIDEREFKQLLKTWIPWAIEVKIPLGVLYNIPNVPQHILPSSIIKQWVGRAVSFERRSR